MSILHTRTNGSWLNWGSSTATATDRSGRRRSRLKTKALRGLESLEDRTLLNASIDIDGAGLLNYKTDSAVVDLVQVSVSGTVYTFNSSSNITILSNVPGLTVTGNNTPLVTVDGISGLVVDAERAGDSVDVASTNVDTAINLNQANVTVHLGDDLSLLTASVAVTGLGTATPGFLDVHNYSAPAGTLHTLTSTTFTASNGFGGLTYAGLSDLTIETGTGAPNDVSLLSLPAGTNVKLNQGALNDHATVFIPGTGGAASTVLDGGGGHNTLTLDAGGLDITPSNFTAGPGPATTVWGGPVPGQPIFYTNYQRVDVTNLTPAVPTNVTAETINAVQGQRLVDAIAGSFTSSANWAEAHDFTATINWGDGTSSAGWITEDAVTPQKFYVMGTHTYWENAPALPSSITVTSMAFSTTLHINGVPVTFHTPSGGSVTDDGSAVVANAPIDVTVSPFSGLENLPVVPLTIFVASFTDQGGVNPADPNPVGRYAATIDWGDGTGTTAIPTSAITQNANTNSYDIALPEHVYTTPGTYIITVTVSDGGLLGAQNPVTTTATGVATIADAPLTAVAPQPAIADATEDVLFVDKTLASFTDANPLATVGEYTVTIDWGDGSPMSYGRVVQPGGVGQPFFVLGSHTYADAQRSTTLPTGAAPVAGPVTTDGHYPIRIFVQDTYGSAVNLTNTIKVLDQPITVAGKLNPLSDSGASNSDAITNVRQPNFFGSASEAGALVFLYATPFGGTAMLIGQATADSTGAWSITSGVALADGGYEIQAQAYDASGNTISALTTITPTLVIDTVGPKVNDVYFDNFTGRVYVTYEDLGGVADNGVGVNQSSLVDANNYRFSMIYSPVKGYKGAPQWLVTSVAVDPGTNVGEQVATIVLNNGRPIRGGHYSFSILSASSLNKSGVRDLAGNALDGEFYSYFPSGNNVRGGDFLTRLDAVHNINYAPKTLVGPATPVSPPGWRAQNVIVGHRGPRPMLAGALAARNAGRPGMALAAATPLVRPRLAALRAR